MTATLEEQRSRTGDRQWAISNRKISGKFDRIYRMLRMRITEAGISPNNRCDCPIIGVTH
jgi:hypothetical protein